MERVPQGARTLIDDKGKAGTDLMMIKQGDRSVEAYIADFKIIIS